jgi:hypothetical protein
MSFAFKNFLKISLKILLIFRHLFYQSELIFGCIFYKPSIKIPDLRQSVQKYIFLKKMFCFKIRPSLSNIYI